MPNDAVRKRCTDCRRNLTGTRGKAQWCPDCGGEMRAIPYGPRRRKVPRRAR